MATTTSNNDAKRLFHGLELPASGDFHVHLRDGEMLAAVAPTIAKGGVDAIFVMVSLFSGFALLRYALLCPGKLGNGNGNGAVCILWSLFDLWVVLWARLLFVKSRSLLKS